MNIVLPQQSKLKYLVLVLFFWLVTNSLATGQSGYTRQIYLMHDNDFFVIQKNSDRYYTYGLQLGFRRRATEDNLAFRLLSKFAKNLDRPIESYAVRVMAYTPSNYDTTNLEDNLDRPFAGLLLARYQINTVLKKSNLNLELNGGIMGPSAKAGQFQNWFHNLSGDKYVPGWGNQFDDQVALHLIVDWRNALIQNEWFAFISESRASLGTIFLDATQGARLIIGKFAGLNNSSVYNNQIRDGKEVEILATASASLTFIGYDATIKGNIFKDEMVQRPLNRVVGSYSVGINLMYKALSTSLEMIQHTGRVAEGFSHRYGQLKIGFRF